jgi:hypothetical protein
VDELFAEYATAYARGERPAAGDLLARAGADAEELAALIDGFLARAPRPGADADTLALFQAWRAGESPLLRLRTARGLKREAVVGVLVRTLGLDSKQEAKVGRYYRELESGLLDSERVSRRVWEVLANTLGARSSDLRGWRPPRPGFEGVAYLRASKGLLAMQAPAAADTAEPRAEEEDEIDRLFRSG